MGISCDTNVLGGLGDDRATRSPLCKISSSCMLIVSQGQENIQSKYNLVMLSAPWIKCLHYKAMETNTGNPKFYVSRQW